MTRSILIAGATGNTGQSAVETLSRLLGSKPSFSDYKIIALTRSKDSATAQSLAKLPFVQLEEKSWVEVTPEWLQENNVERAFIAPHLQTNQFAEESTFHLALLHANVKYVVRISTAHVAVRPDSKSYYQRAHWAIEALLSSPEFEKLQFTSLQPNAFGPTYLYSAAEFVKNFRNTGKQGTLGLMAPKDFPVAIIHPPEIGVVAAHLLAEEDTSKHNKAKYVLNGPKGVTGQQIVQMVEQAIGTSVENVVYKDMSSVDSLLDGLQNESRNVISSLRYALEATWEGKPSGATSPEILDMGLLKHTPAEMFNSLIN
ncbi:unnamed protein product [Clonostachys rosea]|uniref:NmrA-like domain-containing protein n=1 Tax=Bionectria ochroleuca TaxID=29856 RepID=A0ABY6U1L7_BIOOC|nr:unnamed protein product [Clonostachys rosea]